MAGRKKKGNKTKNSTKSILRQLLKISLKTDDYIYNNRPVTKKEAECMKDELCTYKRLCLKNDVRTKQIIEKQSQLLKGIIKEQENMNLACAPVYVEANGVVNICDSVQLNDNIVEDKSTSANQHTSVTVSDPVEVCDTMSKSNNAARSSSAVYDTLTYSNSLAGVSRAEEMTNFARTTDICIINNSDTTLSDIDTHSHINKTSDVAGKNETITLLSQEDTNFTSEELTNKGNDEFKVTPNTSSQFGQSLYTSEKNIYQTKCIQRKNDLSWIDSMKYIRVVEDDEYDPNLSSFLQIWDKCLLPKDWDESDFSY